MHASMLGVRFDSLELLNTRAQLSTKGTYSTKTTKTARKAKRQNSFGCFQGDQKTLSQNVTLQQLHCKRARSTRKTTMYTRSAKAVTTKASADSGVGEKFQAAANIFTNLFPLWVAGGAVLGLKYPSTVTWFQGAYVSNALALTMLGMGLTLTLSDFKEALKMPKAVMAGVFLQYTIMPILGYSIGAALNLPAAMRVGLVLVACCPGGTASNLVTYIAHANVALSVVLTTISTGMAAFMTPLLTKTLVGTLVPVNALSMLVSTAQMVAGPIAVGVLLNRFFPDQIKLIQPLCPPIAVASVALICSSIVGSSCSAIMSSGGLLLCAVCLLHLGGFTLGFTLSKLMGFADANARTISIEVGMQNSALGAVLATQHFANPLTAVPCAISATCHSVMGSFLAGFWRYLDDAVKPDQEGKDYVVYEF